MLTNTKTIAEALGASGSTVATITVVVAALRVSGIVWAVQQERRSREIERLEEQLAAADPAGAPSPCADPRWANRRGSKRASKVE